MSGTGLTIFRWAHRSSNPGVRKTELGTDKILAAELFDAEFPEGDSNYNCCDVGSDGNVYFALATHHPYKHARLYRLDPSSPRVELVADIGEAVGEAGESLVPHGKIHVNLFEFAGTFHTATSRSLDPSNRPYSGGRFLELDIQTGGLRVVGAAPTDEGILSMAADHQRARLYGLTWPSGLLLSCDLATGVTSTIGRVFGKGERGGTRALGSAPICRSLALDPRDGAVYWSDSRGRIRAYRFGSDSPESVPGCRLSGAGLRGRAIWRQIVWHPRERVFYGIQDRHSVLFRFDPHQETLHPIDHIPASQYRSHRSTNEPRGSLAFRLAPDGETLYYLATGPSLVAGDGRRVRRTVHFITYHLPTRQYRDSGVLRLSDGRYPVYCQSMAIYDQLVYAVCWIEVPSSLDSDGRSAEAIRRARAIATSSESEGFVEEVNLIRFPVP